MRHSIRFKLTLFLTILLAFTILAAWLINWIFLDDYYLSSKMKMLGNTFRELETIYHEDGDHQNLSAKATEKINRLETNKNVQIYVYMTDTLAYSYPAYDNISIIEKNQIESILYNYLFVKNYRVLQQKTTYNITSMYDRSMDSNYIDLVGNLNNTKTVIMRTNYENIRESVAIANKFLAYIGVIVTLIGTMAMLLITKRFTTPIKILSSIAKKMSDLDFDIKYQIKTKDEIGELGNSINTLSEKLESTILELKTANNELMNDLQKKIEIDEMRKEFLSNVSHELKTPLSLIQGYSEGLKENINEDEESRNFYCDVIIDEADKMNKMVKRLLSLNELEFGNNQVNFDRFDIVTLIRSVLNATEILFRQKEVILHFAADEPIYVWADEYLIEQVVTNYISNALNHVAGSGIIEIKLIKHNDVVRVAVFNTGENIPDDELDKIWIKFYKVDKARTREYGGNGIGLSIVKAVMNSLNRECGVNNHPQGVEFWFELDTKI